MLLGSRVWQKQMKDFLVQALIVAFMSGVGFIMMGLDKNYAQNHQYRISERILMGVALFGGWFGIYLGMRLFHHKTKKPLFTLGVPLIALIELVWIGYRVFTH